MMKKSIFYFLVILTVFLTFSCKQEPTGDTIAWENDGTGFLQYSTNDTAYYGLIRVTYYISAEQDPYLDATFNLVRKSGAIAAEYGVVLCYQDSNNFYRVLIRSSDGNYLVTSKVGGVYSNIQDWEHSINIETGYDMVNKIRVARDDPSDTFTIYFNDIETFSFPHSSLKDGTIGFYTAISSSTYENFPDEPNDTRFQITLPDPLPLP